MSDQTALDLLPVAQHCTPIHLIRRRMRLVSQTLRKDNERCYILEILLLKHAAIRKVRVTPAIGNVVIHFNPKAITPAQLLTLADRVIQNLGHRNIITHTDSDNGNTPPQEWQLSVEGMSCASCALLISSSLNRHPRIHKADVNFATETATVNTTLGRQDLIDLIDHLGYRALPVGGLVQRRLLMEKESERQRCAMRRSIWATALSTPVMILGMFYPPSRALGLLELIMTVPVVFGTGRQFFTKAWTLARQGSANMDSLVALGVGSAYGYSLVSLITQKRPVLYFEAAAGIVALVLCGRYLEERTRGQAHEAIRRLVELQPAEASVLRDGQEVRIPADDLQVGDQVLIRPGERIPADGEVIAGNSSVNEAMVTGESMPVNKVPGEKIIGGCINIEGMLTIRILAVGEDTILSGIVKMVSQAQSSRLPIQKTVDQVSAVFVPSVMVVSAATLLGWLALGAPLTRAVSHAVAVLLIACPCALGLATPAAIMVGTGQAARKGVFIRNGESLEMASHLTVMILDKTGTLTEGRPQVTDLLNYSKLPDDDLLLLTAAAEVGSEHFLARAIVARARELGSELPQVSNFTSVPGHGIAAVVGQDKILVGNQGWMQDNKINYKKADADALSLAKQGKSPVFIAINGKLAGLAGIADTLRDTAVSAVAQLHEMGIRTLMVTGDVEPAARHLAEQVGISEVIARATPEDKLAMVRRLQAEGAKVGMTGDGVNDAPALAAADVGFAVGGGTDVAMETADMTLTQGDIGRISEGIELSRFTLRVIRQNLFWAFAYNVIAIPLAVTGRLSPMIAAGAMGFSSVSVILNSLRLQYTRQKALVKSAQLPAPNHQNETLH